ncbi:hypothetical protein GCM10027051_33030 [Niabella terrae]
MTLKLTQNFGPQSLTDYNSKTGLTPGGSAAVADAVTGQTAKRQYQDYNLPFYEVEVALKLRNSSFFQKRGDKIQS